MTQEEKVVNVQEVRQELLAQSATVKTFTEMIVPGSENVLGIRLPVLRKLAKQIIKDDPREFLENNPQEYYEERLLQCFVLGGMKDNFDYLLKTFQAEFPYVDNWAVNDALCMDFKICRKHREETYEILKPLFISHKEFEVRIAAVMLLCHYVTDEYVEKVIKVLDACDTTGYYAMMGVAWAVAEVVVKFPQLGIAYLRDCHLDKRTRRKAIQKSLESFRVSDEDKAALKEIRALI